MHGNVHRRQMLQKTDYKFDLQKENTLLIPQVFLAQRF